MAEFAAVPDLLAKRAAEHPDRLYATEVAGRAVTYAQVWSESRQWAAVLGEYDVGAGDTVLSIHDPSITAFEVWMGTAALNAIEVPVNTEYIGDLLTHVVTNSQARVLTCSARHLPQVLAVQDACPDLRSILVTGVDSVADVEGIADVQGIDVVAVDPLVRAAAPIEDVAHPQAWDIACIVYTSGTTGPSKGVMTGWGHIQEATFGMAPRRGFCTPESVIYDPYPTFHVSGKGGYVASIFGGGRVVIREKFNTAQFWNDIREHDCTSVLLMATTANFVAGQPPRPDDADSPLRYVMFSPWIADVEGFKKRFGVEAYTNFNMTEICCPIVAGWDNEVITDPLACGKARPGFDLRVVDDHDREVPAGTVGELVLRADEPWKIMAGYWKMPEKTVEAWRNQWFHTGDLFTVDTDGVFRYVDRKKDSIRRRGENISSMEIEKQVVAHPAVLEAAAVAVRDEISGEEVKVVVTLNDGANVQHAELAKFLDDRLPRFMRPRYIEIREELPKTPTSKIRKAALRADGVLPMTWDRTTAG
ncbi:MAG: AMP-binding protein [Cumulibacter sp.]